MGRRTSDAGFTLVEILIVVVILGILGMLVIPKFASASAESRCAATADQLRILREQVSLYRAQHQGLWPGTSSAFPAGDAALFVSHIVGNTDRDGNVSATRNNVYCYGAYLPAIPANPMSGMSTVKIDASATPTPDDSTGWIYTPATGRLLLNTTGKDPDGKFFIDY